MSELVRVRLIGRPSIESATGGVRELGGHKTWAVLTRVLLSDRPLTRRQLCTELFADADDSAGLAEGFQLLWVAAYLDSVQTPGRLQPDVFSASVR